MTKALRAMSLFMLLTLLSSPAKSDLYDEYINSVSKSPFVAFLARGPDIPTSLAGHAFVAIGIEIDNGVRVYERIFGYYPSDDGTITMVKSVFTKVDGALKYKLSDTTWDVEYRISIDSDQRASAIATIDNWAKNDPKYNVIANGGKNCTSLISEVASALGLRIPDGAGNTRPVQYIEALRKLN